MPRPQKAALPRWFRFCGGRTKSAKKYNKKNGRRRTSVSLCAYVRPLPRAYAPPDTASKKKEKNRAPPGMAAAPPVPNATEIHPSTNGIPKEPSAGRSGKPLLLAAVFHCIVFFEAQAQGQGLQKGRFESVCSLEAPLLHCPYHTPKPGVLQEVSMYNPYDIFVEYLFNLPKSALIPPVPGTGAESPTASGPAARLRRRSRGWPFRG